MLTQWCPVLWGLTCISACAPPGAVPPSVSPGGEAPAPVEAVALRSESPTPPGPRSPVPPVPILPRAEALWGSVPTLTRLAAPPVRVSLPEDFALVDLVVDDGGSAWVLGSSSWLLRIHEGRAKTVSDWVCRPPRPKNLDPETPYPVNPDQGHALHVSGEGLQVLISHPGATAPYFEAALRRPNGTWKCGRPPFAVGANVYGAHHSGGGVWLSVYGRLTHVFPDQGLVLPGTPKSAPSVWVPSQRPGAPPLVAVEDDGALFAFDGLRWQPILPEVPEAVSLESLFVDREGAVWGVSRDSETECSVAFDSGSGWQRVPVPATVGCGGLMLVGRFPLWLVGEQRVARWDGETMAVAERESASLGGSYVDSRGRLWIWGTPKGGDRDGPAPSEAVWVFAPEAAP